VLATIPVGLAGLIFEHQLRTIFAKPLAAATFLTLNGVLLLAGELLRRRAVTHAAAGTTKRSLETLSYPEGLTIGSFQILAQFAGISRSGATIVGGLWRGLLAGSLCIAWFA
jgi:undecaprenyl-diphosphatase